jgi:hypothetical protein
MRKKAVNHVYDVIKAVYELEKELKGAPGFSTVDRQHCAEHLKVARQELHQVLDEVYFRQRTAESISGNSLSIGRD